MRAALLADTHIAADAAAVFEGGHRPAANAAGAVEAVRRMAPDLVFFLGDLAFEAGEVADYARFQELFAPAVGGRPSVLLPGNHDRRDRMLARFAPDAPETTQRVIAVVETPELRLIGLDSLYRTDVVPGLLGQSQREWLDGFLAGADERPTTVLVHHHLGADDWALLDGDRLLRILERRSQVKAVFTAHQHVYRCAAINGLHLIATPALGMPFEPEERLGWLETVFDGKGAAITFHGIGCAGDDPERRLSWRSLRR